MARSYSNGTLYGVKDIQKITGYGLRKARQMIKETNDKMLKEYPNVSNPQPYVYIKYFHQVEPFLPTLKEIEKTKKAAENQSATNKK